MLLGAAVSCHKDDCAVNPKENCVCPFNTSQFVAATKKRMAMPAWPSATELPTTNKAPVNSLVTGKIKLSLEIQRFFIFVTGVTGCSTAR